jgi:hypothetical protein
MQYTNVLSAYPITRQARAKSLIRIFDDTLRRIFGCHHRALSRPFTHGKQTYIACLKCGMHREFDLENWRALGPFYADGVRGPKATVKPIRLRRVS